VKPSGRSPDRPSAAQKPFNDPPNAVWYALHDLCDALCFIQDILELFRRQRLLVASVREGDGLEVHHLRKAFSPGKPYGEVGQQFVAVVLRVTCRSL